MVSSVVRLGAVLHVREREWEERFERGRLRYW